MESMWIILWTILSNPSGKKRTTKTSQAAARPEVAASFVAMIFTPLTLWY
jgi:hypothetical protein